MSSLGNYKDWKPKRVLVDKLTYKQVESIDYNNNNWSSGNEGGRYDSNEGMRSSSFSSIWFFLGLLGRGIPLNPTEERKQHLHEFLLSLGHILPCGSCRDNFDKNLVAAGYDPKVHLRSRQAFSRFINHFHNVVNVMLKQPIWQYEDHRDFYETLRAKCTPAKNGKEGGCNGALSTNDKKATCVIKIVSDKEAKKFIKNNGGRISMSADCKMQPTPNSIMKQLHDMTLPNTKSNKKTRKKSRSIKHRPRSRSRSRKSVSRSRSR